MTLPGSGTIKMSQVNTELGLTSTAAIDLDNSRVRGLAEIPDGTIAMSNLYGKADVWTYTFTNNQTNFSITDTWCKNNGWNGYAIVHIIINSGVYFYSTSTGSPALQISGTYNRGLYLYNRGYILGCGGSGGSGGSAKVIHASYANWVGSTSNGTNGSSGGLALRVYCSAYISNYGTIAGGGGGGGGGAGAETDEPMSSGAGTWGVGVATGGSGGGGGAPYGSGGSAGTASHSSGRDWAVQIGSREGNAGNKAGITSGGKGGASVSYSLTSSGSSRIAVTATGGAGGAGGDVGYAGRSVTGSSAGSAGAYISGNSNVNWLVTGTRLGGAS